jgi:hypothetical protein
MKNTKKQLEIKHGQHHYIKSQELFSVVSFDKFLACTISGMANRESHVYTVTKAGSIIGP